MLQTGPITRKTAVAAIEASKAKRDPFGVAHAFNHLSIADQNAVREWFRNYAKGFVCLNDCVTAIANGKLGTLTK